jgi:hypothetical protein
VSSGLKKAGGVHHNQLSASYLGEICREPFGTVRPSRIDSANFPLKLRIMGNTYLIAIRIARLSYLDEIPPANAAFRYAGARPLYSARFAASGPTLRMPPWRNW